MDELNLNIPDLREDVKTALPILFGFIPESDRAWGIATKLYRVEVEKNYRKAANSIIEVEATLHDIIRKAVKGDTQAAQMIDLFTDYEKRGFSSCSSILLLEESSIFFRNWLRTFFIFKSSEYR